MYSISEEMTHWYKTLFNGQILDSNSLNEITTFVGSGNYGMGISQKTVLGRTFGYMVVISLVIAHQ